MRHDRGAATANVLRHTDARRFDLIDPGGASQLLHQFDNLVDTS